MSRIELMFDCRCRPINLSSNERTLMQTRLFYIDDSGAARTGYAVFAHLTCDITTWTTGLASWLALRRRLFVEHGIPPAYELHANEFLTGHGRPSLDPVWNLRKTNRVAVAELALETIGACSALEVGSVYRRFTRTRDAGIVRAALYSALLHDLDRRSAETDSYALVFVDGDGSEPAYPAAHRSLPVHSRRIIEDALFLASHRSQWIQMADLVAYVAYQSLVRDPARQFCWSWYDQFLRASDPNGGPQER